MGKRLHIDTNFFIGGFHRNPQDYQRFAQILSKLGYEVEITNYIEKELRWYLRRSIIPHIKVIQIDEKELNHFIYEAKKIVGATPQIPDMSVIFNAHSRGGTIISSDLKLIQVAEAINVPAVVNSAFILRLIEETDNPDDKEYLHSLYERLFADEVTYSVKAKDVYDPVIRIRKIMESAIQAVGSHTREDVRSLEIPEEIPEENSDVALELKELIYDLRRDIDQYIEEAEKGNLEVIHAEILSGVTKLLDLLIEFHTLGAPPQSRLFQEGILTIGHLLLLLSSLDIALQDPYSALKRNDDLLLLMLQSPSLTKILEIEVHLQRIVLLLLNDKIDRLRGYFTPSFMQKIIDSGRSDLQNLLNVVSILAIVLTNKKIEVAAIPKSYDDVEFIMQLGFQFSVIGHLEEAMLVLEQAFHMALNAKMLGVAVAILEYLAPINLASGNKYKEKLEQLYNSLKEVDPEFSGYDVKDRIYLKRKVPSNFVLNKYLELDKLPPEIGAWFDVLGVQEITFRNIGKTKVIKVVDWENQIILGVIDRHNILPSKISVGSGIKINSGKFALLEPPPSLKDKLDVDLLLLPEQETPVQIFIRRAGVVSIASSKTKLIEYDL